MTVTRVPEGFERDSWAVTWMNTALSIAKRSACVRAQCGAVIITPDNRMAGLGYNGQPKKLPVSCSEACPRAFSGTKALSDHDEYETCISVHAEANAILHSRREDREGATIFVTTTMCINCAKMVANSGISAVVMRVGPGDAHRKPDRTIAFLQSCGLEVKIWDAGIAEYRRVFMDVYGVGPHRCHFCTELLAWIELVHHLDGNHDNNDPKNLVPAHSRCHQSWHNKQESRKPTREVVSKIHDKKVSCPTCGKVSTRAGIGRHRSAKGH